MVRKQKARKKLVVCAICLSLIMMVGLAFATSSLTAKILLNIGIEYSVTDDLSTKEAPIRKSRGVSLANGTGANQADTVFQDVRTLTDDANETLNLNLGSLENDFGTALTLDILKVLYIKNNSSDANLLIGGSDANQVDLFGDVSDILKLPPGGEFLLIAPDVTGIDVSTDPNLEIWHDGTGSSSLTYDIIVVGVD